MLLPGESGGNPIQGSKMVEKSDPVEESARPLPVLSRCDTDTLAGTVRMELCTACRALNPGWKVMPSSLTVLVVEDDADTRANLVDILDLDEHLVELAATAVEARRRNDWQSIDAIILDWKLPDETAEQLLPWLREQAPEAAIIISTGAVGFEGAVTALRHGAFDYILKPIQPDALRASPSENSLPRRKREATQHFNR